MSGHVSAVWRHTVSLGPALPSVSAAVRASVAVAVPLALLFAAGRLDWALYAGFGAFAAVYGRYDGDARRLWLQASAGATILTAMLLGTAASAGQFPVAAKVLVVAVVAWGANLLSSGLRWAPPGPIFSVFAAGACLSVPATAATFAAVLAVGGGTVLWCLLLALAIGVARRGGVQAAEVLAAARLWEPLPHAPGRSLLMGVAALAAGLGAQLVLGGHWYWASLAAIAAVTGADAHARVGRGLQRFLGTAVGVVLAAALFALDVPAWALLLVAVVFQGLIELIVLRNYGLAMGLITVVALSMLHLARPESDAGALLSDRLLETGLGVLIGIVLSVGLGLIVGARHRRAAA
ncbi:MAG: FUSC family protein [Arthrobacter sp.]|jgi:hypothetical protein|nr:FUSC family protein [Arthrobacter sp.]